MATIRAQSDPVTSEGIPQPPSPPLSIQYRDLLPGDQNVPHRLGLSPFSIGQPTDEEQLYLEYINRMRANPTAEGRLLAVTSDSQVLSAYSYFNVDLSLMQSEFSTNSPVPPLAMNAQLLAAARWHSGDMYTNDYQGHYQTNGTTVLAPWDRMTAEGYTWSYAGENVYAYSESVFYGHAGFAVDWGPGSGGMQNPPGHRQNMLSPNFREIGIGVVDGSHGSVGPQLVTQDLANQPSNKPFITGVVYYDFNHNGFYDRGEGIGGVLINSPGSTYYALTANSGGYTLPVSTNGNYTLTFSGSGLTSTQIVVSVSNLQNTKVDYVPVYTPNIQLMPNSSASSSQFKLDFTVANYRTNLTFHLWRASSPASTWVQDNSASLQTVTTNSAFRFTTSSGAAASAFFRVLATY
jgi:hypothetical protein